MSFDYVETVPFNSTRKSLVKYFKTELQIAHLSSTMSSLDLACLADSLYQDFLTLPGLQSKLH